MYAIDATASNTLLAQHQCPSSVGGGSADQVKSGRWPSNTHRSTGGMSHYYRRRVQVSHCIAHHDTHHTSAHPEHRA